MAKVFRQRVFIPWKWTAIGQKTAIVIFIDINYAKGQNGDFQVMNREFY